MIDPQRDRVLRMEHAETMRTADEHAGCSAWEVRSTIDRRGCRWARRGPAVDSGGDESGDDEDAREPVARRAQATRPERFQESYGATTE